MANWYFERNGETAGPVSEAGLRKAAMDGIVKPSTLVWKSGMANWSPFSSVEPTLISITPIPATVGSSVRARQCARCGQTVQALVRFCPACGKHLGKLSSSPPDLSGTASPAAGPTESPVHLGGHEAVAGGSDRSSGSTGERSDRRHPVYASFQVRVAALVIDVVFFLVMTIALPLAAGYLLRPDLLADSADGRVLLEWLALISLIVPVVVTPWFESSPWQATPGKKIMKIRVCDLQGRPMTFPRACGRQIARLISCLTLGFVLAAFTRRCQGLHDLLAATLVVRTSALPVQCTTSRMDYRRTLRSADRIVRDAASRASVASAVAGLRRTGHPADVACAAE